MKNKLFQRILRLNLPEGQSAFLWGARKTGKSSYLKIHYPHKLMWFAKRLDHALSRLEIMK